MFAVARWALAARRNRHEVPLNPPERNEAHHLFHHLWTAAGSTHYDKKEWVRLEGLLRISSLHDSEREGVGPTAKPPPASTRASLLRFIRRPRAVLLLWLALGVLVGAVATFAITRQPRTYEDCVLTGLKYTPTATATEVLRQTCGRKFPR